MSKVYESAWWDGYNSWIVKHVSKLERAPFSFIYNGKHSDNFLHSWEVDKLEKKISKDLEKCTVIWFDRETGLKVSFEAIRFTKYPAIEWVVRFKNERKEETPVLEDIQALDTIFSTSQGEFVLHGARGSFPENTDFAPVRKRISRNSKLDFHPKGGRPSDNYLPFFNLEWSNKGVMIYIGWSGQWLASFIRKDDSSLRVRAGMELTHLRLYPGERIRTPSILLLFWHGERLYGHNLMRRLILKYYTPKNKDGLVQPPVAYSVHSLYYYNATSEKNLIDFIKKLAKLNLGVECVWLDAGWFRGGWPNGVGNWFPRKDFPRGLGPVADVAHKKGLKFLVWFEPERVHKGTWLDKEHPEWIIRLRGVPDRLLNLGNNDARKWLTEHISNMIKNYGIDIYRHDFNIDPLSFWRSLDKPDRQGIAEIRYIEGLYAFWDELLKRHPNLIIDNCASGGKRIDLETIKRSVPLWRTDLTCFCGISFTAIQAQTMGILLWLPARSAGTTGYCDVDQYKFRSLMSTGISLSVNLLNINETSVKRLRKNIAELKELRQFFDGDFYPLTPYSLGEDRWAVYQLHREDLDQGIVLAFRRPLAPRSIRVRLYGVYEDHKYELTYKDTAVKKIVEGNKLINGIRLTLPRPQSSLLIKYIGLK